MAMRANGWQEHVDRRWRGRRPFAASGLVEAAVQGEYLLPLAIGGGRRQCGLSRLRRQCESSAVRRGDQPEAGGERAAAGEGLDHDCGRLCFRGLELERLQLLRQLACRLQDTEIPAAHLKEDQSRLACLLPLVGDGKGAGCSLDAGHVRLDAPGEGEGWGKGHNLVRAR
eukprot:scaffold119682_cov72-Phaeocystis_antarctica.AAC.2